MVSNFKFQGAWYITFAPKRLHHAICPSKQLGISFTCSFLVLWFFYYLTHNLPSIKQNFIPFAKSIFWLLWSLNLYREVKKETRNPAGSDQIKPNKKISCGFSSPSRELTLKMKSMDQYQYQSRNKQYRKPSSYHNSQHLWRKIGFQLIGSLWLSETFQTTALLERHSGYFHHSLWRPDEETVILGLLIADSNFVKASGFEFILYWPKDYKEDFCHRLIKMDHGANCF